MTAQSATAAAETPRVNPDELTVKPLRHPGRIVLAVILIFFAIVMLHSLLTNENLDYAAIAQHLFDPRILSGVGITILITVLAMIVSSLLAVILTAMRMSDNPVLSIFAAFYIWAFRGTPLLVQVVLWGYLGLLYQRITIGIPFTDIEFWSVPTNLLLPAFVAGTLALTLNQAAYSAEIVRSGMLSVDEGQGEAAASLGMTPQYTFRRVLLPQAMRVIIPPMGNELISMLKNTSLLSVIAVLELYTQATLISAQNLKQVELLIVVSIWYLFMTSVLSIPQHYLEVRFGRGSSRTVREDVFTKTLRTVRTQTGSMKTVQGQAAAAPAATDAGSTAANEAGATTEGQAGTDEEGRVR